MARMFDSDPDHPGQPDRPHDVSQRKNYLMALGDQVDRADGGSPFPRVLRSPLGAVVVLLLVIGVTVLIGRPF